jgi:hypothetical protein
MHDMERGGYACKIDGKVDGELYVKVLDEDLQRGIKYYDKTKDDILFQQDNDPKHKCKKAQQGFKIMTIKSWTGLHNPQTLTQLNTFGII